MKDILSFLKEEYDNLLPGGVIFLFPDKALEVIRVLEENATTTQWLKDQREIQERNIEAFRQSALLSYEELEKKDTRIKHLEDVIEQIKKLNSDFLYDHNLAIILNEA